MWLTMHSFLPKYTWSSSESRRISIHNDKIPIFSSQDWKPFHHTACMWTGTTFYRKRWQFIYRVTLTHPTPKSTSTWQECTATYRIELDDGISYLTWAKVSNIYSLVSICWAQKQSTPRYATKAYWWFCTKVTRETAGEINWY